MQTIHIDKDTKLEMGCQTIILDKMFGPTSFCELRISIDKTLTYWIIEKEEWMDEHGTTSKWTEVARVHCQESMFGKFEVD